jgi:D-alanine-D-alanine ligase
MSKKKIILLYGGRSAEREVSILSAFSVMNAIYFDYYEVEPIFITHEGQWIQGELLVAAPSDVSELHLLLEDGTIKGKVISPSDIYEEGAVVFPVLHGPMGEDGTIQGFFETIGMPYVGAGVLASANAMDKIMTKYLLQVAGIPQVPFVPVRKSIWKENPNAVFEQVEGTLRYPVFVKPANMGSSVGISKAESRVELKNAIDEAVKYDSRILVEQGIHAREIEIAVLGNEDVRTTYPGEVVKDVEFYDYNAKYIDNKIEMAIPAEVPAEIQEKARMYAKQAYEILDGSGLARCDFFLTSKNELFLNELNTMPGFTQWSMYPLLWENMGLKYSDLIEELIHLAVARFTERQTFFEA